MSKTVAADVPMRTFHEKMETTLIARVRDGLILCTSVESNNGNDQNMVKYTNQAKMIFKRLSNSPEAQTIESGPFYFHYVIKGAICCLVVCERDFPRRSAFAYLEDIANEFLNQNATRLDAVVRPHHFLDFEPYLQLSQRKYSGERSRLAMQSVNSELQDVARIMVSNIEDVIHRGEALNILESRAQDLAGLSRRYREDARNLNRRALYVKIATGLGVLAVLFLFARFFIFV